MNTGILIFAKLPEVNFVKTRLITSQISGKDTHKLYKAFLRDTIEQAIKSKVSKILFSITDTDRTIYSSINEVPFLSKYSDRKKVQSPVHIQPTGDFGERMLSAIRWAFTQDLSKLIVLGADSPHIQPTLLDEVIDNLDTVDAVIGPSRAAGVYLIGLNRNVLPDLSGFDNVFSAVELIDMANFFDRKNIEFKICQQLTDIDTEEDLVSMIAWIKSLQISSKKNKPAFSLPHYTLNTIDEMGIEISIDTENNRNKFLTKKK